jgi:hypothetical protein
MSQQFQVRQKGKGLLGTSHVRHRFRVLQSSMAQDILRNTLSEMSGSDVGDNFTIK